MEISSTEEKDGILPAAVIQLTADQNQPAAGFQPTVGISQPAVEPSQQKKFSYVHYDTDDEAFFNDDLEREDKEMKGIDLYEEVLIAEKVPENAIELTNEDLIYEELDELLEKELREFVASSPNAIYEIFDPDRDLEEIEYLIANPGATLLKEANMTIKEEVEQMQNSEIESSNRQLNFQPAVESIQPTAEVSCFTTFIPETFRSPPEVVEVFETHELQNLYTSMQLKDHELKELRRMWKPFVIEACMEKYF